MTPDDLDGITVDLILTMRDSLTDVSPLDFWSGRVSTALETAAAGSDSMPQAITTMAHKLQIDTLAKDSSVVCRQIAERIGEHYQQWAEHVARTGVYVVALARVVNDSRKTARKAARVAHTEELSF